MFAVCCCWLSFDLVVVVVCVCCSVFGVWCELPGVCCVVCCLFVGRMLVACCLARALCLVGVWPLGSCVFVCLFVVFVLVVSSVVVVACCLLCVDCCVLRVAARCVCTHGWLLFVVWQLPAAHCCVCCVMVAVWCMWWVVGCRFVGVLCMVGWLVVCLCCSYVGLRGFVCVFVVFGVVGPVCLFVCLVFFALFVRFGLCVCARVCVCVCVFVWCWFVVLGLFDAWCVVCYVLC